MIQNNAFPQFCTVKQAVKRTGFSERFIRNAVRDGSAPHVKAGAKILVNVPAFLIRMDELSKEGVFIGQ